MKKNSIWSCFPSAWRFPNRLKTSATGLGIELDPYGFCHTTLFDPLQTSREGIFVAGPFREPKDIPETVIEASGAAASAARLLAPARFTLAQTEEYPPERDVTAEEPRIGVFVCHCGSNIGGYLDVPGVAEYAGSLPGRARRRQPVHLFSRYDRPYHRTGQGIRFEPGSGGFLHTADPRTAVPGCPAPRRAEPAPVRDGQYPQPVLVGAFERHGIATIKAKSLVRMAIAKAAKLESTEGHRSAGQ